MNGFIFPANVESGCHFVNPMLAFLKQTVANGKKHRVRAIHHMRIEESSKFANTFLASRFYWDDSVAPSEALRQYVRWIANANAESADKLFEALMLLETFLCAGAEKQDHLTNGRRIRDLVESAFQPLAGDKAKEHEWLQTTGQAMAIIGEAIDRPEKMEELSARFSKLMQNSPTFSPASTTLQQYVKWIKKGWNQEHF